MKTYAKVILGLGTMVAVSAATYAYMTRQGSTKRPEELIEDAKMFVDEMKDKAEEKFDKIITPEFEDKVMHRIRDVKKSVSHTVDDVEQGIQSTADDLSQNLKIEN